MPGRLRIDDPELLLRNRHSRLHITTVKDGGFLLRTKVLQFAQSNKIKTFSSNQVAGGR